MSITLFGLEVSILALLGAAVVNMVVGALWYGPIFGKQWMALVGKTEEEIKNSTNMGQMYGMTFINALIMSFVVGLGVSLAKMYYYPEVPMTFLDAAILGKSVGFAMWVIYATTSYTNGLFNDVSKKLWALGAGYWLFVLVIAGAIFALWG